MPERSEDQRGRVKEEAAAVTALAKDITDQAHALLDEAQKYAEAFIDKVRRERTAA
jgi:hypothetical protein